MAFEGLSDKLSAVFKRMRNKGKLKESDIKEAMREVRLALLEADVNYKVTKEFVANVTAKAVGDEVLESLTPAQMVYPDGGKQCPFELPKQAPDDCNDVWIAGFR